MRGESGGWQLPLELLADAVFFSASCTREIKPLADGGRTDWRKDERFDPAARKAAPGHSRAR
jgi:hypothetical protein